ncbi:MAG: hypothetical protein EB060_05000 [Proteobacteria bacterium]|nr:hypothetical protein [Pseudomonadota bacterium]
MVDQRDEIYGKLEAAQRVIEHADTCSIPKGDPVTGLEAKRDVMTGTGLMASSYLMPYQASWEQAKGMCSDIVLASRAACRLLGIKLVRPQTAIGKMMETARGEMWHPGEGDFHEYLEKTDHRRWFMDVETAHCAEFMARLTKTGSDGKKSILGDTLLPVVATLERIGHKNANDLSGPDMRSWREALGATDHPWPSEVVTRTSFANHQVNANKVKLYAFTITGLLYPDRLAKMEITDFRDFPLINPETKEIDDPVVIQAMKMQGDLWEFVIDSKRLKSAQADCADHALADYVTDYFPKEPKDALLVIVTDDHKNHERLQQRVKETGMADRALILTSESVPLYLRTSAEYVRNEIKSHASVDGKLKAMEASAAKVEAAVQKAKANGNGKNKNGTGEHAPGGWL